MSKRLIYILLLFSFTFCEAQTLTLDSCLTLAKQNNRTLKSAQLDVSKATEVRNQARTKYFPQVSLFGAGYHALNPMFEFGIEDIPNNTARAILDFLYENIGQYLGMSDSWGFFRYGITAQVTAMQPVYMGGKIVAGNRLAKVGVQAAELQQQVAERDLLLDVEESYWLVLNLTEKEKTVTAVQALLDTVSRQVSSAVDAGLAMPNDLLQVQLRQDEIDAKALQLKNGIYLATYALCQSIGIPYSDSLNLVEAPGAVLEESSVNRPERDLLSLNVRAEELRRRMSLADALPQVLVGGSYGYTNALSPFNQTGYQAFVETDQLRHLNGLLGLTVRVPLTDWWSTAHKLKEHDITIEQAKLQQADLNEKMDMQKIQAYNTMTEAEALCRQFARSVESAQENFRISDINYKAGLIPISDLLQAQTLLLQASNSLSDAKSTLQIAIHRYQQY